jgi:membrane-associated phospholipid phosphatase
MARWHFGATKLDRRIADAIARNASPAVERPARLLTWVADEHLLFVISAGLWLASRAGDQRQRRQTDHLVLCAIVTAILPHFLKRLVDQERPDRCMIHGRRHGIPRSGKPYDAFPSGHAMHVGAIASAVSWISPKSVPFAWSLGGLVAATRIVLLAHWMTDVLAGLAMGVVVERCLRPLSAGAGRRAPCAAPGQQARNGPTVRKHSSRGRRSVRLSSCKG